ncbi:MAG: 23S rRNA (uracil(1939)-C(5))-methyltransferase RlmD [Bacteroidota bacterium]
MGRKKWKAYQTEVEVQDAATDGRAVARDGERVIFIKEGVPGDILEVEVFKREKKAFAGRILNIVKASEDRIEPHCKHFGSCGGCKWQMMSYKAQLTYKEKQVRDCLERIGKVEVKEFHPILGADSSYFYRNKLEFSFGSKSWLTREQISSKETFEQRVLGFHAPGFYDKIIDIDTCHLQTPLVNDIRNSLKAHCREHNIPFFNVHTHEGFLRNLVFRTSQGGKQYMVMLILREARMEWIDRLFSFLSERFPQVENWVYMVNEKLNSSYSDLPYTVWKGTGVNIEQLGSYQFQISPVSFFQTHTAQAQRMYEIVFSWLKELLPSGKDRFECVYDLYTGTGSIAIFISSLAKKVVGIEYVASAVEDAWENVRLNALNTEFRFFAGDMKKVLNGQLIEREGVPEVMVTDPPRQGMDAKVIKRILEFPPAHIIYISCKPATQARDLALLKETYEILRVQPVDMFPQTAHVENLVLLRRKT